MVKKLADVYVCDGGHSFAVIHQKRQKDVFNTVPCSFCRHLAHFAYSFHVNVPLYFHQEIGVRLEFPFLGGTRDSSSLQDSQEPEAWEEDEDE